MNDHDTHLRVVTTDLDCEQRETFSPYRTQADIRRTIADLDAKVRAGKILFYRIEDEDGNPVADNSDYSL